MAALSGLDWNHFPKLFVDYDSQRPLALKNAKPLSGLRSIYKENNAVIDAFLKHSNRAENNYVYLPIVHDYNAMIAVLTAKDAQLIEIIEAKD